MSKKFALCAAAVLALGSQAQAATSIYFREGVTSLPTYTTATPGNVQSFNGQALGPFQINTTNTVGNESVSTGGTKVISSGGPNGTNLGDGRYLVLTDASYTLDFGSQPVQFLSFLVSSYRHATALNLFFSDGTSVTNDALSNVADLDNGDFGRVVIDALGGLGISRVTFVAGNNAQNAFVLDSITAAVPEPGTWALMIVGFGIVGWQLRSRRKREGKLALA